VVSCAFGSIVEAFDGSVFIFSIYSSLHAVKNMVNAANIRVKYDL